MSQWVLPLLQLLLAEPREGPPAVRPSRQLDQHCFLSGREEFGVCICSTLHSDAARHLRRSSRPLCLAWNPNLNNHGMVRLSKLSASKTGSLLCTYPVVLLRNALGWVEPRDCRCKKVFCWFFVLLGPAALLSYLFLVVFSLDVVWRLCPVPG